MKRTDIIIHFNPLCDEKPIILPLINNFIMKPLHFNQTCDEKIWFCFKYYYYYDNM